MLFRSYGTDELHHYIVDVAEASRQHPDVALGASPRAALCILRCARARALLDGRHYFTHEDVQAVTLSVLGHRLIVRPEAEVEGKTVEDIVTDVLEKVPVLETKLPPSFVPPSSLPQSPSPTPTAAWERERTTQEASARS